MALQGAEWTAMLICVLPVLYRGRECKHSLVLCIQSL